MHIETYVLQYYAYWLVKGLIFVQTMGCLLDPQKPTSMKFETSYNNMYSRKYIWKCRLPLCSGFYTMHDKNDNTISATVFIGDIMCSLPLPYLITHHNRICIANS